MTLAEPIPANRPVTAEKPSLIGMSRERLAAALAAIGVPDRQVRMRVGQLSFFPLSSPAERPYGSPELGSSYQGQVGPTPSRYRLDIPPKR